MQIDIEKELPYLNLPMVAQSLDFSCGAACFESMHQYFKHKSLGEMHFANELGALTLGYTPPKHIQRLTRQYGIASELKQAAVITDLIEPLARGEVIFVTWWDEDAGHYSLVKNLEKNHITLMDPWLAREGLDNRIELKDFIPNWIQRGSLMICCRLV